MIGAIEFLRKAKAICESREECNDCPVFPICHHRIDCVGSESNLVSKVMSYKIKVESHGE